MLATAIPFHLDVRQKCGLPLMEVEFSVHVIFNPSGLFAKLFVHVTKRIHEAFRALKSLSNKNNNKERHLLNAIIRLGGLPMTSGSHTYRQNDL